MGRFYVSLEHRDTRKTHHPFHKLDRAQDFAMRQMWEEDVMAYVLTRARRCPVTKEIKLTCIAGHVKPKESKFIRGIDGSILLKLNPSGRSRVSAPARRAI